MRESNTQHQVTEWILYHKLQENEDEFQLRNSQVCYL